VFTLPMLLASMLVVASVFLILKSPAAPRTDGCTG
jgi:hypothetical protein